jgi:hypothetical protein
MKNKQEKKLRKKLHKRRLSDEFLESLDDEGNRMEVEPVIEIKPIQSLLDLRYNTQFDIKGRKGHINYYAKQTLNIGIYYFEVTPTSMDYNFLQYVTERRNNDDFSKIYYENVLTNIKDYSPNIRVGFIHEKADQDVPLGAETYSYGLRVSDSAILNEGLYECNDQPFTKGNTYGVLIHLKPPMPGFLKMSSEKDTNNECYIKFFINGVEQKKMFKGIWEGSYKPAVTLYNFSQASVNFGPNYRYTNFEEYENVKQYYTY